MGPTQIQQTETTAAITTRHSHRQKRLFIANDRTAAVEGGAGAGAKPSRRRPSPGSSAPAGRPAASLYRVLIAPRCTRSREPWPSREGPERGEEAAERRDGRMINAHITRTAAAHTHARTWCSKATARTGCRTQRVNSELDMAWRGALCSQ